MGFSCITLEIDQKIPAQEWGILDPKHLIRFTSSDMLDLGLPISMGIALVDSEAYVDQSILIDGFEGLTNPIAHICKQNNLIPNIEQCHIAADGSRVTCHTFEGLGHLISLSAQNQDGQWTLQSLHCDNAALYLKILGIKTRDLNPDNTTFIDIPSELYTTPLECSTPFEQDAVNRPCFTNIKSREIQIDVQRNHITIDNRHYSKTDDVIPEDLITSNHLDVYDQAMAGPFFSRLRGKYDALLTKTTSATPSRELKYQILRDSKIIFYDNNSNEKRGVLIERLYIDEEIPIDNGFVKEHQYYRIPGYIKTEIVYDATAKRYVIESSQATHPHVIELYDSFDECENLDFVLNKIDARKQNTAERIGHILDDDNLNIPNALGRAGFWPIKISADKIACIHDNPFTDIIRRDNPTITTEAAPIRKEINGVTYFFILEHHIQFAALESGRHLRFEVVSVFRETNTERVFDGMYVSTGWQNLVKGMLEHPNGIGTPLRQSLVIPDKRIYSTAHQTCVEAIELLKQNSSSGGDDLKDYFSYLVTALEPYVSDTPNMNDDDFLFLENVIRKTIGLLTDDTDDALVEYEFFFTDKNPGKFLDILKAMKDIAAKKRSVRAVQIYSEAHVNYENAITLLGNNISNGGASLKDIYSYLLAALDSSVIDAAKLTDDDFILLETVITKTVALLTDDSDVALLEYEKFFALEELKNKFQDILKIMQDIAIKKRQVRTPQGKYNEALFELRYQLKTSPILEPLYRAIQDLHSEKMSFQDLHFFNKVIRASLARVTHPSTDGSDYLVLMNEVAQKTYYKNNLILTAMFVIFTLTAIAALALIVPHVATYIGLELASYYCVGAAIVTGVSAMITHVKINRYSPLYDALKPIKDLSPTSNKPSPIAAAPICK